MSKVATAFGVAIFGSALLLAGIMLDVDDPGGIRTQHRIRALEVEVRGLNETVNALFDIVRAQASPSGRDGG